VEAIGVTAVNANEKNQDTSGIFNQLSEIKFLLLAKMNTMIVDKIAAASRGLRLALLGLAVFPGLVALSNVSAQQPTPKFRVAEKVEVLTDDGRWYSATVQRIKKPDEYLLSIEAFPKGSDTWFKEDKVRAAGGGEIVPVEYIRANFAAREKFAAYDAHLQQQSWNIPSWQEGLDQRLKEVGVVVVEIEKRWPSEKWASIFREGFERRTSELAAARGSVASQSADATNSVDELAKASEKLKAYYEPLSRQARQIPMDVSAESMVNHATLLATLDFAAIDARVAQDKKASPEAFKYYGMEEKGRRADLEWGGQKRPAFSSKTHEQLSLYWLPAIYEAKAKLAGKEAELARAVQLLLDGSRVKEDARKALELARAVEVCKPATPGLAALIASCETRIQELNQGVSKPEVVASKAPASSSVSRKPIDVKKINSGVELYFSNQAAPGSKARTSFAAGDFIYAHARFKGPITQALINPVVSDNVAFPLWLFRDDTGEELDIPFIGVRTVHLFNEASAGGKGYLVIPIVSNPAEDCFIYANNVFNQSSWEPISKLPPGTHVIEARLQSSAPKVDGVPLAVARLELTISPEGIEKWKNNSPAVFAALAERGGEIVDYGLRAEGPEGWKIVAYQGKVRSGNQGGRFSGNDFIVGIWKAGQKSSDGYTPEGGAPTYFVKRVEGGYAVQRQGKTLVTFKHNQTILDRNGKPWGKITNDWDKVNGVGDLLDMVAGLHHFGDLLK
jgi:hypothetical protein